MVVITIDVSPKISRVEIGRKSRRLALSR